MTWGRFALGDPGDFGLLLRGEEEVGDLKRAGGIDKAQGQLLGKGMKARRQRTMWN
jgi:hypothetical protein